MKLEYMKLRGFRGYQKDTIVRFNNFTSIIGRNDVGKSTILEAMSVFFNGDVSKPESSDLCVHADEKHFEISCAFSNIPEKVIIDSQASTSLHDEKLLNEEDFLEIVKRYDCTGSKIKISIYLRAFHYGDSYLTDLIGLKIADLRRRALEVGVDMDNVDKTKSASLRSAIRQKVLNGRQLSLKECLIPLEGDDMKKVWEQIEQYLPMFALFQADRPSKDDDAEVQDPMKIAVSEALKEVQSELDVIRERVRRNAMDLAHKTLDKLREMDHRLADELTADFKSEPKWDGFKLSLQGANGISINKRGSGVRRLILLNFFRADAERRQSSKSSPGIIYAVEEPETSQHPSNQIMLVKSLLELSSRPNVQVVTTTHVPGIAGLLPVESIQFVKKDGDGHPLVFPGTNDVLSEIANDLGVYPDKRVRILVYVEGPHDVSFLERINRVVRQFDQNLPDIANDQRIAFVLSSGGNLRHWVTKNYLQRLEVPQLHIYDRDEENPPKYQRFVDEVNGRGNGDYAVLTRKREMENYLHPDAIKEALPFDCEIDYGDDCDVPLIVAKIIHENAPNSKPWDDVNEKKKSSKESNAKSMLNTLAVEKMTLERLALRDPDGEVVSWFQEIAQRLQDAPQAGGPAINNQPIPA